MKSLQISEDALKEVKSALQAYYARVSETDLSEASKSFYIDFADCFVRWLEGAFEPGSRANPYWKRRPTGEKKVQAS
jgi:hypothetical protein